MNLEKKLSQFKAIVLRLSDIKALHDGWCGVDSVAISNNILKKCEYFLSLILNVHVNIQDIVPTPYGTLTIDIYNQNEECISVEIGENGYAFFTLFADKTKNTMVECTPNLEDFLPKINESLAFLLPEIASQIPKIEKTQLDQLLVQVVKETIKNKMFNGLDLNEILDAVIDFGLKSETKGILDAFKAEYPNEEDFVKLLDDNFQRGQSYCIDKGETIPVWFPYKKRMTGQDFINLIQENNLQTFEMAFDYDDFRPLQSALYRTPRIIIDEEEKTFEIPLMIKE